MLGTRLAIQAGRAVLRRYHLQELDLVLEKMPMLLITLRTLSSIKSQISFLSLEDFSASLTLALTSSQMDLKLKRNKPTMMSSMKRNKSESEKFPRTKQTRRVGSLEEFLEEVKIITSLLMCLMM